MKPRILTAGLAALLALSLGLGAVLDGIARAADPRGGVFGAERLGARQDRIPGPSPTGAHQGIAFTGELLGGSEDSTGVTSGYGSLTVPLPKHLGLDVEALSYHSGDDKFSGAGAHLYWRNPEFGLLGVTASTSTVDIGETDYLPAVTGIDNKTYGIEAEAYLGPVAVALQTGRIQSDLALYDRKDFSAFDVHLAATRRWYWLAGTRRIADGTTNRVETGYTTSLAGRPMTLYAGGTWDAFDGQYLGAEFAPWTGANSRWVGFVEFDRGEQSYDAAFAGIRYEFGPVDNAPMISLFDRVTGGF